VAGRQFARLDQFKETDPLFWEESPTNVVHLPQNKFEVILREEVSKNVGDSCELLLGYEAKDLNFTAEGTNIVLKKSTYKTKAIQNNDLLDQIELNCDYLVAADGANSIVRRSLDIDLHGQDSMHTLMNVHFTCHGLRELLNPRPAMLYFVFNESLIAVFVAHDPEKDEWVCQIPIFPPFKNPEDFDKVTLQRLLRKGLGLPEQNKSDDKSKELEIVILTVNHWTMHAQVAEKFTNENTNVFLTGDAAHRFPPAGGFGMNTGLQDAHNIGSYF
jgi:2-polyprenyl-6-methoxyphenol hydroxylase-like FAD-dependent oxidoreductase